MLSSHLNALQLKRPYKTLSALYPWVCWFLCACFMLYKYILQVSPSVMVPELMHTFHLTGASMGSLAACYFYAYLMMQLPTGLLLDRYNPRYLMSLAILICASGAYVFCQAQILWEAQLGRILIGVGGAFSAVGTMKIIALWFKPNRFALVSGLMMSMAMLGAIGGEAPLAILIHNIGWRHALSLLAATGFILACLVFAIVRNKENTATLNIKYQSVSIWLGLRAILRRKQNWLISFYAGLAFAPMSAFAGLWGIPFLVEKYTMTKSLAASLVSLAFLGFACGAPFAGWLSDKIQRRKPLMAIGTSVGILLLMLIIYSTIHSLILLGLVLSLFGFFSGFFFIAFATIRETNPQKLSGTSIAFINMFNAFFGALSEPIIGKLLDLGWQHQLHLVSRLFSTIDYEHALTLLPIALGIALISLYFVKESNCKTMV